MEKSTIKIIVCVSLFLIFGGLSALTMLVDINLGFSELSSIEGVIAKREKLLELEDKLEEAELEYTTKQNELVGVKADFEKAKAKYEAISDKTIDLIREATTEENYDIEYMWIKLGNYALVNNLSIVMVEPGGTSTTVKQNSAQNGTTANSSTTSTSTSTTTATANSTSTTTTDANSASAEESSSQSTTTSTDSILTVTVEGSYLNMADFVFEVENDKELRFKLDNIEITCVTGTTIKAKFNVKNVIVLK